MRIAIATLFALIVASAVEPAKADPYRWCAQYGGKSGAVNCYFVTLEQCRAALSGNGGFGCDASPRHAGPQRVSRGRDSGRGDAD